MVQDDLETEAYVYATAGMQLAREYGFEQELERRAERVRIHSLMEAHGMSYSHIEGGE